MLKASYYEEPTELDRQIFEHLVRADHFVRKVKAGIDFEALRAEVADLYSPDMGRTACDPVRLIKLLVLAFHYDLSDRDVLAEAEVNVAFRFFLDLAMTSKLPHPTIMTEFRNRLGAERFERLFERVLGQARALGIVSDRLRLKDATHLIANVAVPSTLVLVAQMRERLLETLRPFEPAWVSQQQDEVAQIRAQTQELKDRQRLIARVEQLRRIVARGDEVAGRQRAKLAEQGVAAAARQNVRAQVEALEQQLELAHKVLSDREPKAKDKLVSLTDPDARRGRHGSYYTGYLLDLTVDADTELITAVDVLTASGDEAANAEPLIASEESAHGNDVKALSIDSIGYRGEVLERLSDAEDGPKLEVFVPPYERSPSRLPRFGSEQFELDEARGTLECPAGQQTRTATRQKHRAGVMYTFRRRQCQACPLREQCLGGEAKRGYRQVFKSDYERQLVRAREVARTEQYAMVRREHPRVERKLADLIRNHGGRRVRYRRLARVRVQYILTAMVVNIKRIVNVLLPRLEAQTA